MLEPQFFSLYYGTISLGGRTVWEKKHRHQRQIDINSKFTSCVTSGKLLNLSEALGLLFCKIKLVLLK